MVSTPIGEDGCQGVLVALEVPHCLRSRAEFHQAVYQPLWLMIDLKACFDRRLSFSSSSTAAQVFENQWLYFEFAVVEICSILDKAMAGIAG
jgi:hypothetical protein